MSRIKRKEGLHRESLVLPSSFRLNLGGIVRPKLRGKALKEFEEQKKKMTEFFLESSSVSKKFKPLQQEAVSETEEAVANEFSD